VRVLTLPRTVENGDTICRSNERKPGYRAYEAPQPLPERASIRNDT